jgi:hypothetical protein
LTSSQISVSQPTRYPPVPTLDGYLCPLLPRFLVISGLFHRYLSAGTRYLVVRQGSSISSCELARWLETELSSWLAICVRTRHELARLALARVGVRSPHSAYRKLLI